MQEVGAAGAGRRAGVAAGGSLRVRVPSVSAAAVAMGGEGGAASVYRLHGLCGQNRRRGHGGQRPSNVSDI